MGEATSFAERGVDVEALTPQQIQFVLQNAHKLPREKKAQVLAVIRELTERRKAKKRRDSLLDFIMHVDKDYKIGVHHKHLAALLEDMAFGRKDRIAVNIAPRFGKSQLTSIYFPAWFIGNFPDKKIMMISHTADLAVDFGRKVRNLVASDLYKSVFPDVSLAPDSKSAGRWSTNKGGEYFAVGVGGALAGRGADLMCIAGDTPIRTVQGVKRADCVQPGDRIWGFAGFEKVEKCFTSTHEAHDTYYDVGGVHLTGNHPVWTFDNGWTAASKLTTHNICDTLSLWSYIRLTLRTWYEQTDYAWRELLARLPHMVAHATAVLEPERGELQMVRRARDTVLCAVAGVRGVLARYWAPARPVMDVGSRRPQRGLHAGELQVGRPRDTGVQPPERGEAHGEGRALVAVAVVPENGAHAGRDKSQGARAGHDARAGNGVTEDELGAAPRAVHEFGWVKRAAFRFISGCRACYGGREGFLVGCAEAVFASRVFGLLMGVRRYSVAPRVCGSSTTFYNFQTADSNTYYAGELMTHNCIDDPHNEGDVLGGNYEVFDKAYDWYTYGARTRLMPGGRVALIMTRWALTDLTGRVVQDMVRNPDGDQWEVVEFPALIEKEDAAGNMQELSLWPEQWSVEALLRTKASMPPFQWNAQYMQNPTAAEAAIVKPEWWQKWEKDEPPACDFVIMSLDAAAEKNNRADYTALTTWGVFTKESEDGSSYTNIILLNAIKERWEFPTLKRRAYEEYRQWKPDWFVIERKSAGTQLYQEMRTAGIPVQEFTPHRGSGDKTARLNAVSDIFASGMVWYPAGRRWAEEVVEEVCGFPAAPNDDLVDSTVMALMKFRLGGFIRLPSDRWDEEDLPVRRHGYY